MTIVPILCSLLKSALSDKAARIPEFERSKLEVRSSVDIFLVRNGRLLDCAKSEVQKTSDSLNSSELATAEGDNGGGEEKRSR